MESNSQISNRVAPTGGRRKIDRRKPKPLGVEEVYAFAALPDEAHVARPTVCALLDVSVMTLTRMVKAGVLPQPVRFSRLCIRWRVGALRAALSAMGS
jgi:hypothetical protein